MEHPSTRRIDRARMQTALDLHQRAYAFWMWLSTEALRDPELLSAESEAALADPRRCVRWLVDRERDLPERFRLEAARRDAFASLVSSFLHTSFHVRRFEWGGRLVDAKLMRGPGHAGAREARRRRHGGSPTREALHRLCRDEGVPATPELLRAVERAAATRADLTLWTYAVGLVRRAERGGEGEDDWKRWRAIDREQRLSLDSDAVWDARERLLAALRERAAAT